MEVTCPACAARYTADAEKLRGKTARMRCRACDTVWVVSGPEEPSEARRLKRGEEREQRDLFAAREPDFGSVPQTMRPPPPSEGVGARNETSVLFTVSALRDNARVKTPEPSVAPSLVAPSSMRPMMDDDEGVIDLHALATVPPKAGARPVAPLFSEPPPAAFSRDAASSTSDVMAQGGGFKLGKRAMVGIAAAAAAVVLVGVGIAAAFRGEEPVVRATASMAPIPPSPAATAPAKPPEPPPAAPAPAASSSDDDSKANASTSKKKNKSGGGKLSSGGGKASSSSTGGKSSNLTKIASSGVSKPAPASDKCGCKGDFNCNLRCAAGK